jgi:hypothetical protein
MSLGRAIYRENRIIDTVTYELVVYAMPGGVYGTFRCPVCGLTEVNAVLSPTDVDALRATLHAVDAHHATKHRPG